MNINPPAVPLFLMSLFILGLIALEIYSGRIGISRSIKSRPDWTRKNYPYSFWVVILTNPLILDEPESAGESMASA